VGWLLLALGLSVVVEGVAEGYALYGAVARPGVLPAARQVAAGSEGAALVGRACLAFVLLLTPCWSARCASPGRVLRRRRDAARAWG
jgi:hypothetical protein